MEMMSDSFSQLKISLCNPEEPESVNSYAIALVIILAAVLLVLGLGIGVAMFLRNRSKKEKEFGASEGSMIESAVDEQAKSKTTDSSVDSTAAPDDGTESAFKDLEQSMKAEEGSAAADSAVTTEDQTESKTTDRGGSIGRKLRHLALVPCREERLGVQD
ncbi:hypothetical protein GPALN_012433 [Globodera pallida]|nr:hypothetical protein GPALN_012433 [Globodera pallida]